MYLYVYTFRTIVWMLAIKCRRIISILHCVALAINRLTASLKYRQINATSIIRHANKGYLCQFSSVVQSLKKCEATSVYLLSSNNDPLSELKVAWLIYGN